MRYSSSEPPKRNSKIHLADPAKFLFQKWIRARRARTKEAIIKRVHKIEDPDWCNKDVFILVRNYHYFDEMSHGIFYAIVVF